MKVRPETSGQHCDVLVVGSGFGGSVTALRLTEKGYRVGVLEAGRRWADEDFAQHTWDVKPYMWVPRLGLKGIQRIHLLPDVLVLAGAGVGGGSLVYSNVLYEPKSEAFYTDKQWAHITDWRQELAPYYDQAKRMLGRTESPTLTVVDRAGPKGRRRDGRRAQRRTDAGRRVLRSEAAEGNPAWTPRIRSSAVWAHGAEAASNAVNA